VSARPAAVAVLLLALSGCAIFRDHGRTEVGVASWYDPGDRAIDRRLADSPGLTAAHRTLPFGTRLLVTDLQNGRQVTVTVTDRGPLGGFKWSSQHLDQGGCGGPSKAAFGSVPARRVAVPGPPLRGAAGGSAPVLGVDRGGTLERGRRSWRRRGAGSRDTLVPGGGRHATVTSLAVVEAAA